MVRNGTTAATLLVWLAACGSSQQQPGAQPLSPVPVSATNRDGSVAVAPAASSTPAAGPGAPVTPEVTAWPWPRQQSPKTCAAPPPGAPELELLPQFGSYSLARDLVLSADGRFAVFVDDSRNVRLWDVKSGELRAIYAGHRHRLQAVAFHPTRPVLVSVARDEPARFWDLASGTARELQRDPGDGPHYVRFSPDGRTLVLAYADHVALHEADGTRRATLAKSAGSLRPEFSQDSRWLMGCGVSYQAPDQFVVWDLATGQERARVPATPPGARHAALSPDGRLVVWAPSQGPGGVTDASTGALRASLEVASRVESVQVSADSRVALVGGHGVSLFDTNTGRKVADYPELYGYHAHLLPDGGVLASSLNRRGLSAVRGSGRVTFQVKPGDELMAFAPSPDHGSVIGSIHLLFPDVATWDARTGALRSRALHQRATTNGLVWSPDGTRLAVLSGEGTGAAERVQLLDPTRPELQQLDLPVGEALETLDWSQDGALIAVGTMREVYVCDARTGKRLSKLNADAPFSAMRQVLFLPDGRLLAAVSLSFQRTELRLHEPRSGKQLSAVESPVNYVHGLALSADRQRIAVAGSQGTVIVDARALHPLLTLQGTGNVMDLGWTPDGKRLVIASNPNTLTVWDALSGKLLKRLEKPAARVVKDGHNKHQRSVAISPDGKLLVSGGGNEAELWDLQKLTHLTQIAGDEEDVDSVRWAPHGDLVAIGRRSIQLVRTRDGESVYLRPVTPANGVPTTLAYTRSGLYTGSAAALGLLRFRRGSDRLAAPLVEVAQVPQNNRPTLVKDLESGCLLSRP